MGNNGLYMSGAMIGNGISGIFTSVLQFICLACINHKTLSGIVNLRASAGLFHVTVLFFVIIAILMVASTYGAYVFINDEFTKFVIKSQPPEKVSPRSLTTRQSVKALFGQAWPVFLSQGKSVFFTFVLTFVVFPGVVIAEPLQFVSQEWAIPLIIFFFNLFDTAGRTLPSFTKFLTPRTLFLCVCLR
jgi:hypothetical protein